MMFDFSFHMDFGAVLPAIAAVSVILLISGKIYNKIRVRFPIKVNCWFCNSCTRVPYNSSNSWYCPECDQYNGFSADGGYNRPLAEQFSERLNRASWAVRGRTVPATNGLCRFCNVNLRLKVEQLARFVPLHPDNYDREVQQYSDRLERVYRLCGRCDVVLAKTLHDKQETLVAGQRSPPLAARHDAVTPPPPRLRVSVGVQSVLAVCELAAALPSGWTDRLALAAHPPPPPLAALLAAAAPYVTRWWLVSFGCLCQTASLLVAKDRGSVVGLLVWLALLALDRFPVPLCSRHAPVVHGLAAAVLLASAVSRGRRLKPRTVATVKPLRLHKLSPDSWSFSDTPGAGKTAAAAACKSAEPRKVSSAASPEDLGLGRLRVGGGGGGRPVTRSQTRHFQACHYPHSSAGISQLFKGLTPATLPPPLEPPPTRCSSLSSGFVSRPSRSASPPLSVDHDVLDSISQCGPGPDLIPYHGFPPPYSPSCAPLSSFTVTHVGPPAFGKLYAEMLRYEASVDRSSSVREPSVLQKVQAFFTPLLFVFLITSNTLVLWKLFGEQYFKTRS